VREIALHLLDIAENSVSAQAKNIILTVCEDLVYDRLTASVRDDGRGMDAAMAAQVTDPFVTSRTTRKVGLGIPLLKAAAEACNGYLTVSSALGEGTTLEVEFQHSHIDRMPLGDLAGTLLTLVVAYPGIRWILRYQVLCSPQTSAEEFIFDTHPIQEAIGDLPLCEPEVLAFIRSTLEEGISGVQSTVPEVL
jgi:hypothetical protein